MTRDDYLRLFCDAKLKSVWIYGKGQYSFLKPTQDINADILKEYLDKICIARKREDIKEEMKLPELFIEKVEVNLTTNNKNKCETAFEDYYNIVKKDPQKLHRLLADEDKKVKLNNLLSAKGIIELMKMLQIISLAKVDKAIEIMEQLSNQKVVLFCDFIDTKKEIENKLKEKGITYIFHKTDKDISKFQKGEERILITSIKLGGEGVEFVPANKSIFISQHWTPAQNQQAISRIHRLGQKRVCQIFHLFCKEIADEKIEEANRVRSISIEKLGLF